MRGESLISSTSRCWCPVWIGCCARSENGSVGVGEPWLTGSREGPPPFTCVKLGPAPQTPAASPSPCPAPPPPCWNPWLGSRERRKWTPSSCRQECQLPAMAASLQPAEGKQHQGKRTIRLCVGLKLLNLKGLEMCSMKTQRAESVGSQIK